MKKLYTILFYTILIITGLLRIYKITGPVADWHSWRQADTAAVARNFLKFGTDLLRPRYDDLSNIQSGYDNPEGYRMVEVPIYQFVGSTLTRITSLPIEISLRIITIIASIGTTFFIMKLISKYENPYVGLLSGFVFAVLPYSIYYGRSILPDPMMVFFAIGSLYISDYAFHKAKYFFPLIIVSGILGATSLCVKPVGAFLLIPILYIFVVQKMSLKNKIFGLTLYGIICIVPLLLWRQWILQFKVGIPVYQWLFNGGNIRFKGAWFWWLFAERIGKLILGFWGLIPFGIGLNASLQKKSLLSMILLFSVLLYFMIIARGNVQHDYYQILSIPVISILVGKGIWELVARSTHRIASILFVGVICAFMISFSWYTIRTYYWINRPEIIEAGKKADSIIPKNAKVIAPYNGDTTFLYQINRQGWPIGFDIDKKIQMGATHYVTVSPTDNDTETRDLANKYTVLVRNNSYAIIDLTRPR